MSTVTVTEPHSMSAEQAVSSLRVFETDIAKYGMSLDWSGNNAKLKGTGASGEVRVTDAQVTITVKLGMMAKMAGVDADRLRTSLQKRLREGALHLPF